MPSDYKMWTIRPPSAVANLLIAGYKRWSKGGRGLDHDAALDLLEVGGLDRSDAVNLLRSVMVPDPGAGFFRSLNRRLVPKVTAALALQADPEVRQDLDDLGTIVATLARVRARRDVSLLDLAAETGLEAGRVERLLDLGELPQRDGTVDLPPSRDRWATFDDFLGERVPVEEAPSAPLPCTDLHSRVLAVRWLGLGPFRASTTLDLERMTVLVGANGAGKTCALVVLALQSALAHQGPLALGACSAWLRPDTDELMLGAVVDLEAESSAPEAIDWQSVVGTRGRIHVRAESFDRVRPRDRMNPIGSFRLGSGTWNEAPNLVELQPDALALTNAVSAPWQVAALRLSMQGWYVRFSSIGERGDRDEQSLRLWSSYAADAKAFDAFRENVRVVTGMRDLELREPGSWSAVDESGMKFERGTASAGVVQAISILAWLFAPRPPLLLAVDDFEAHLHGDLVARLLDVLRSVSDRTQIVLTTHSPQVLRGFQPREVRVVRRHARGSGIARLADDPVLDALSRLTDLGDLLQDGYLTGAL